MMNIALGAGLIVFFISQVWALVVSHNVRRLWAALMRLFLLVMLLGLPWLIAWGYPQAYRLRWAQAYPNLDWVLSWLIPCLLMACLYELVRRLKFMPLLNLDPKEERSPVLAVALVPLAAALVSAGLVSAALWLYGWLFTQHLVQFLPLVTR